MGEKNEVVSKQISDFKRTCGMEETRRLLARP